MTTAGTPPDPAKPRAVADDLVQPFLIEQTGLRGRLVRLGGSIDSILTKHDYPEPVARLLGEMLAMAAALAGALKYAGLFTLQTRSDGPVSMVVADVASNGDMRGYAAFDADRLAAALADGRAAAAPVPTLLGQGYLAFTVDQGPETERYQGIVALTGPDLVSCIQHYFEQSEQLQAGLRLACARVDGHWRATALMVQRLPSEGGHADDDMPPPGPVDSETVEEDWRRTLLLMSTGREAELVDPALGPRELLFRLFHEDGVRAFPVHVLRAACRCSRQRVASVLVSLPQDEIASLTIDNQVEVVCEFCNSKYLFTEAEVAALFESGT